MLQIVNPGALATVQDQGWVGHRGIGLPPSGAMDPEALEIGNRLVGTEPGGAGIELALGDLTVVFETPSLAAVTGAPGAVELSGRPMPGWKAVAVEPGDRISIANPVGGRFRYLVVAGGIAVEPVMGSRSTYLPSGLGGWQGRRLLPGDRLPIGAPEAEPVSSDIPIARDYEDRGPIRIAVGPQGHLFPDSSFQAMATEPFRVLPASNRMGTRLSGARLGIRTAATLPSEGTCVGAIQVPDSGYPIVVLGVGRTVGGYPMIGAVFAADMGRFAQIPLGGSVVFRWVSQAEAREAARVRDRQFRAVVAGINRAP